MKYYRLAEGVHKYKFIPETDDVYTHIKNRNKEWYLSTYLFNEDHYEQFKKTNSVAGITDVVAKSIWWDIDSQDLDTAQKTTQEIVKRLLDLDIPEKALKVRFSGGKGFHISVDTLDEYAPNEVENMAAGVVHGLPGFDTTMYDATQILRLPLTKHKSGLFCTPITIEELNACTIDELKDRAKLVDIDPTFLKDYYKRVKLPKEITQLKGVVPKVEKKEVKSFDISELDFRNKPNYLDNARWALQNGFFRGSAAASETGDIGERDRAMLCLAATYKNLGFGKEHTHHLLKGVAEVQAERTGEVPFSKDEIFARVNRVFSDNWKGGQFSVTDPSSWLYKYVKEYGIPSNEYNTDVKVIDAATGFDNFLQYARNIEANTMRFGIKEIDEKYRAQVGHLIGVLAPPGLGKTSTLLTVLQNTSNDDIPSVMFSYDMHESVLFQKLVQRETGLESEQVIQYILDNNQEKIAEFRRLLTENYRNVNFVFKSGQTIEQMKKTIMDIELRLGQPIKLVGVDYSELVLTQFSDPTQASAAVIQGLREICNEMSKCVIVLLQPNKVSSKPNEPLLSYSCAKGSSAIAQAVTVMLTCHRPGYSSETPELDRFMGVNCVKNRVGPLFAADFSWHGLTGKIGPLNSTDRALLKQLREEMAEGEESDESYVARTSRPSYNNSNRGRR